MKPTQQEIEDILRYSRVIIDGMEKLLDDNVDREEKIGWVKQIIRIRNDSSFGRLRKLNITDVSGLHIPRHDLLYLHNRWQELCARAKPILDGIEANEFHLQIRICTELLHNNLMDIVIAYDRQHNEGRGMCARCGLPRACQL